MRSPQYLVLVHPTSPAFSHCDKHTSGPSNSNSPYPLHTDSGVQVASLVALGALATLEKQKRADIMSDPKKWKQLLRYCAHEIATEDLMDKVFNTEHLVGSGVLLDKVKYWLDERLENFLVGPQPELVEVLLIKLKEEELRGDDFQDYLSGFLDDDLAFELTEKLWRMPFLGVALTQRAGRGFAALA